MPVQVPSHVIDLFAVPEVVEAVPGGQGRSARVGDLVLSPGRDAATAAWLNPVLARLAVRLDEQPGRRARDLRVAMPVPARDGSWVVEGWGASRFEPGTEVCHDLEVSLAAGHLLAAELASVVTQRPPALAERTDPWARAEALAFGEVGPMLAAVAGQPAGEAVRRVAPHLSPGPDPALGPDQLVHADLAGNVLLDAAGAPVVIDYSPAWRPLLWADAVCVLDAVTWHDTPVEALVRWSRGREQQAALRAIVFRALVDVAHDVDHTDAYRPALELVAPPQAPTAST